MEKTSEIKKGTPLFIPDFRACKYQMLSTYIMKLWKVAYVEWFNYIKGLPSERAKN